MNFFTSQKLKFSLKGSHCKSIADIQDNVMAVLKLLQKYYFKHFSMYNRDVGMCVQNQKCFTDDYIPLTVNIFTESVWLPYRPDSFTSSSDICWQLKLFTERICNPISISSFLSFLLLLTNLWTCTKAMKESLHLAHGDCKDLWKVGNKA
jgi:hypothetical protein